MPRSVNHVASKAKRTRLLKKTKKQKRNLDHVAIVDSTNVRQVRELLCLR